MIVYYAALSLDGRIAGPDDDLSFLRTISRGPNGDFERFYEGIDSVVMGARTWDFVVEHANESPYAAKPTWVVTHQDRLADFPGSELTERFAGDVEELVRLIAQRGLARTWLVGGGDLAGQFLAADLLDELILTFAPTLIGNGPALADGDFPLRTFRPVETTPYGEDAVRIRYERVRE